VLSVNPFGAEQLGYSVAELVGQSVLSVFPEEDKAAARDHVARCLAHVGESMSWEIRKARRDGTTLWVRETARAVQLGADPPVVLMACEDVTERKRAEEALRKAQAELARAGTLTTVGELAASIAHELRQPLAAIATNGSAALRWLNRESPDLGEARDAASRIVREAHRADEVIRGLRALVGHSELQRAALGMNDVIHEVLELARGELRRNEVSVQTDLAAGLPPVLGDRVQLQQVLLNLIVNAVEAMAQATVRPKAVVIRTERAETGEVAVAVEDTGPGLDPATAARIFDPFFTTKPNGLGMGLSICRSIVEAHGGQLSASPRAPHGTAFRFTIPTVTEASSPALPPADSRAPLGTTTG
jgi:PAS domain S-box-containing protein